MYQVKFSLPARPHSPEQMLAQALAHHQNGQADAARALYEKVLRVQPHNADALHFLGVIESAQGRNERACDLIEQSISINQSNPAAYLNLGNALRANARLSDALARYEQALALRPDYPHALVAKAVALDELDRWEDSLHSFALALAAQPESALAFFNRGNGHRKRGALDLAKADYDRAIALQPDFAQAWLNRGSAHHGLLNLDAAIADFDRAIAYAPGNAEAHFNKALTLMLQGDYAKGLPLHEWRWRLPGAESEDRHFTQPLWLGQEPLHGKSILLHGEQGLGDCIQFCRYAEQLAALGAQVILEVPVPLVGLLARVSGVHAAIPRGSELPPFDWHCPMLSLPLAMGTRLETIPSRHHYLRADPTLQNQWADVLGPRRSLKQVGLVWSGSTWHSNDRNRSIALAELLPHLPKSMDYVSLQRDVREIDVGTLTSSPHVRHFESELINFEATAALCSLLDVMVTVDTSVAHLAGALGVPTLLLLPFAPDWRWLLSRHDSPWYPSMQLIRQERAGDWSGPIRRASEMLSAL